MTDRYYATISHHSISRAREVDVGNDLDQAKVLADAEFGGDFNDYTLSIYDRHARGQDRDYPVAARKMDAEWGDDE